jgi:hypothetical protein
MPLYSLTLFGAGDFMKKARRIALIACSAIILPAINAALQQCWRQERNRR